jgi:transposase-like protein
MAAWRVSYRSLQSYLVEDVALVLAQTANQAVQKCCAKLKIAHHRVTQVDKVRCDHIVK